MTRVSKGTGENRKMREKTEKHGEEAQENAGKGAEERTKKRDENATHPDKRHEICAHPLKALTLRQKGRRQRDKELSRVRRTWNGMRKGPQAVHGRKPKQNPLWKTP